MKLRNLTLGAVLSAGAVSTACAADTSCTLAPQNKEAEKMFSSSDVIDHCKNNEGEIVTCLTSEETKEQYRFQTFEFSCDGAIEANMRSIETKLQECVTGAGVEDCKL